MVPERCWSIRYSGNRWPTTFSVVSSGGSVSRRYRTNGGSGTGTACGGVRNRVHRGAIDRQSCKVSRLFPFDFANLQPPRRPPSMVPDTTCIKSPWPCHNIMVRHDDRYLDASRGGHIDLNASRCSKRMRLV